MLDNANAPKIMGILNVTPDSFSDGGRYADPENALRQAQAMLSQGADIIDVGGESTRPGSDAVAAQEQIRRVVPVIQAIRETHVSIDISVDTTLVAVAEAAIHAGATMINDVSAGMGDKHMLRFAASAEVPLVLMHMQGSPKTMQDNPLYDDVVREVKEMLDKQINAALAMGIKASNLILDPGIGFGKRKQDNLELLAHLQDFVAMGYPVLLGTSRKRFMGSICHVSQPHELVTATAVTTALGVMAGVKIFRVHDILANRHAADVAWAISQAG